MFREKKRIKKMVEKSFGENPLEGYSYHNASQRMDLVRRYHDEISEIENDVWSVDEVTWNDLEMDQVFLRINHTNSFIGEQVLYHRLHRLNLGQNIERRDAFEKRLNEYEDNPQRRVEIETELRRIQKLDTSYFLPEFLLNANLWELGNTFLYHVLQFLLIGFLLLAVIFRDTNYFIGFVAVACVNLVIYLGVKQKYEVYFSSLIEFKKIYEFCKWMKADEIKEPLENLKGMSRAIMGMSGRRQASMSGDPVAIINEYLWGIFLIDVSMFNQIMKQIINHQADVIELMEFVGETDADIAVLSYRKSCDSYCKPTYVEYGIEAKEIAHPLLQKPVKNDFTIEKRAVLTGTNASGKSTFMKAIAINSILAQSIDTCSAKEFRFSPMPIITCMALRDDILTGESYYFREARRIRDIIEFAEGSLSPLVIIDEILKGTNTNERVAASKAILEYLAKTDSIIIVATHDTELTKNDFYENYHFTSKIVDDDIIFDYRIHSGISTTSNAIALLAFLGYPKKLVERAQNNL